MLYTDSSFTTLDDFFANFEKILTQSINNREPRCITIWGDYMGKTFQTWKVLQKTLGYKEDTPRVIELCPLNFSQDNDYIQKKLILMKDAPCIVFDADGLFDKTVNDSMISFLCGDERVLMLKDDISIPNRQPLAAGKYRINAPIIIISRTVNKQLCDNTISFDFNFAAEKLFQYALSHIEDVYPNYGIDTAKKKAIVAMIVMAHQKQPLPCVNYATIRDAFIAYKKHLNTKSDEQTFSRDLSKSLYNRKG